jgi:hypothetical protein
MAAKIMHTRARSCPQQLRAAAGLLGNLLVYACELQQHMHWQAPAHQLFNRLAHPGPALKHLAGSSAPTVQQAPAHQLFNRLQRTNCSTGWRT